MIADVRAMTSSDVGAVQDVERTAGERFRDCDDPRVARCADDPIFTREELIPFVEDGRAWVATDRGKVVGFAAAAVVDGCAHLEEIAVAPAAGRRGHGAALLNAVQQWAAAEDLPAITLTTFRDVPWNGPWYTKLGFRELAEREWTPGVRTLRDEEERKGLPNELRVVMRREVDAENTIGRSTQTPALDRDLPEIVVGDAESECDAAELRAAIHQFNFDATGYRDDRVLACIIRDGNGTLIAGIDGFTWGGYARIDHLWVHEAMRGRGVGSRLLAAAEAEARRRGCRKVVLDTHSFQAPILYRALGYREVGTSNDVPVGFSETHFEKVL